MKPRDLRDVYITKDEHGWFVRYAKRRKGQRYLAGQFDHRRADGTERTRMDVVNWILAQPKLILVTQ